MKTCLKSIVMTLLLIIVTIVGGCFQESTERKVLIYTSVPTAIMSEIEAAFEKEYNSFTTDGMVRKAKKKMKAYRIQGVPSMVINGKYLTSGSMAGSYDNMVKITNYLIEKESK